MATKQVASAQADTADREIVISRLISASIERVWRAWSDPKEIVQWWGPHGFTNETRERAFKEGGFWKHTMIGPDGTRYPNLAKYEKIIEHKLIINTNGGGTKGGEGVSMRAHVTFEPKGNKTLITMRTVFPTAKMREMVVKQYNAIEGGQQTLSRLAAHCEGAFVISRLVEAPRERVWRAWTEPSELGLWFGPKGFETIYSKLDFRPGGTYHYGIKGNGMEIWGKWTIKEIDKPAKLHFVQAFSNREGGLGSHPLAPTWPKQTLSTIFLQDFGPRTLITVYWAPYEASEVEIKTFRDNIASMNQGWAGTWERLDAYLRT
jgi:uncharacterized protein YndB with AHSA1/START domain